MASHAIVKIGGKPIPSEIFSQVLSIKVKDAPGRKSDTAELVLNDQDDQFAFPRRGESLEVTLWRDEVPGAVTFEGVIDNPRSRGSRGGGQDLIVPAKAADMRGGLKVRKEKHLDDATFEKAARAFAPDGFSIAIDGDLGQIRRDYWYLGRESYLHWAQRTADELGATFKVVGKTAVFVPMNAGKSASGKPLQIVKATRPGNIVNWDLGPDDGRHEYEEFDATYYDPADAKWKMQDGRVRVMGQGTASTSRFSAPDQETAQRFAEGLKRKRDREKGGGTLTIDGDPAAQAEALCEVSIRAGISGTYLIGNVEHQWTRGQGFLSQLELKRPGKGTGKDDRDPSGGGGVLDDAPAPSGAPS
ncbi:hypothetical protein GGR34_003683 [Microvirga flocculans]|uniref:Late control protein n=1 Tax=Microvirga flocculans TaxID=217168 RepID=A0A7W6N992_9HYPH|nr:hypothetical protein [Microvirga flocculans]MBB4041998.1 hypothetical protein [Microvirga flocculans]